MGSQRVLGFKEPFGDALAEIEAEEEGLAVESGDGAEYTDRGTSVNSVNCKRSTEDRPRYLSTKQWNR